jgi:predicted amidohydrolase YtcJ
LSPAIALNPISLKRKGGPIRTADLALLNGRVYTSDPSRPWAEAFACQAGRFLAIGTESEIRKLCGRATEMIDADGRLVVPGFIDTHVHLIFGYQMGTWIDLTDFPSAQEVVRRVSEYARAHPEEEMILGHGFDYAALQSVGLPTKEVLDAAVSDRPVLLTAWDGHTGWANSRFTAKVLAAATAAHPNPGGMQFDPESHAPTGIFLRSFDLGSTIPEFVRRQSLDGLRRILATASQMGITSAFDVQVDPPEVSVYRTLKDRGELPVRIRVALYHPPETSPEAYAEFVALRDRHHDDWLDVAAIKLYIDGVSETHSAAMLEPYSDLPDSLGETIYTPDQFRTIVTTLDGLTFQLLTHSTGDRGARVVLDAYESLPPSRSPSQRRHRIEHCEVISAADVPRFGSLGILPCMMPRHTAPELTERWREVVGPARVRSGFPWKRFLETGATVAFASDWPVADLNPLIGIREVVAPRMPGWGRADHALSVAEAVDGYTKRAAYALHAEESRGSISPGKLADFAILSQNLFSIAAEDIIQTKVVRTVVGGRTVFDGLATTSRRPGA